MEISTDSGWWSILPPLLAITLALTTKQVILSLLAGIWVGFTLHHDLDPFRGAAAGLEGIIAVFADASDARVLIFTLLIGALIASIEASGGVRGFVRFLESRRWVHTGSRAQWLAWGTGLFIFIESNITLLVAGAVSRPLFDRYKISREKLAYLIDATSAPVCVMIPLNAWGAVIISLIDTAGVPAPFATFLQSLPYNLYAITAIGLAAVVIWRNIDLGPMRAAQARTDASRPTWSRATDISAPADASAEQKQPPASAAYMVVPIFVLVAAMPAGLYITGNGRLVDGSGSTAILWSVSAAIASAAIMQLLTGRTTVPSQMDVLMKGAGQLLPISTILLLAIALGDVAKMLGTGPYVAAVASAAVPSFMLAPGVFIVSAFIAFSVGSSWGTFAIMIPIAVPIATGTDASVPLFLGAAISGAIFGDHASPISDTTVVASMAAGTDHIDHVRTQLPYALIAAGISTFGFLVLGLL
ncbi:MAG: Na+/H+ antiporter NhaC family protein [Myxococcota bacterium]